MELSDLTAVRNSIAGVNWYPYHSLSSLREHTKTLMGDKFDGLTKNISAADIGAGDGDFSFYLESRGCYVDAIENKQINFNNGEGIEALKKAINSKVNILYQDVDFEFDLPRNYDIAFALGIFYHLKNPIGFLIKIAHHAEHLVLSTRTIHKLPDGTDVSKSAVAYFLERRESNDDPTNYWIFSPIGFTRVLKRSGWKVLNTLTLGAGSDADPVYNDQRTYAFCRRVENWRDLKVHDDF